MASAVLRPVGVAGDPSGDGAADEIERFVREVVAGLRPDPGEAVTTGPGRPRVLPALALWAGLLVGVLRGLGSQRAVWRLLAVHGLWDYPRFPVTDEAVRKRLAEGGPAALVALFRRISAALAARLAPYADATLAPFAAEVVALDSTTLDPLARRLPALRGLPARERLPGKIAGRFDLRRQQWQHVVQVADARENDKVAAPGLLDGLPAGSLVLADLGYFSFAWLDALSAGGYWYVSRLRAKTSYEVAHAFYQQGETFDGLVWLGAYRADRAGHAVRLVQFRQGGTTYQYLTNVLDPTVLPLREVARLYARRWDFELAVKLVKRHLGLHLFWAATPAVVQQQVWATLCVAQILHALHLEVAGRAGVDPFEVSLPLLVEYFPRLAREGHDPVAFFVERGRQAGFIRPSTRTAIRAPAIPPAALVPLPPGTPLTRPPRHAGRNCGKRSARPKASVQHKLE
jgi:hypothetical protein